VVQVAQVSGAQGHKSQVPPPDAASAVSRSIAILPPVRVVARTRTLAHISSISVLSKHHICTRRVRGPKLSRTQQPNATRQMRSAPAHAASKRNAPATPDLIGRDRPARCGLGWLRCASDPWRSARICPSAQHCDRSHVSADANATVRRSGRGQCGKNFHGLLARPGRASSSALSYRAPSGDMSRVGI